MSVASLRSRLKTALYRGGVFSQYHRWRNGRHVTAVMFHRVLPAGDPAWAETELAWAMPEKAFAECLRFFAKHYHPIGLDDLLRATKGEGDLPDRALFVTFDDGWADTVQFALPHLIAQGIPATLFVVAEAIGSVEFWPETFIQAWGKRRLGPSDLRRLWGRTSSESPPQSWDDPMAIWSLIGRLRGWESDRLRVLLEDFRPLLSRPVRRQMVNQAELNEWQRAGMTIGSHGLTHTPIPCAQDRDAELGESRTLIRRRLEMSPEVKAFSFPHGLYDLPSVRAAESAGYKLVFTSDKTLHELRRDVQPRILGRINMDGSELLDSAGNLHPESLAGWLFSRPAGVLG